MMKNHVVEKMVKSIFLPIVFRLSFTFSRSLTICVCSGILAMTMFHSHLLFQKKRERKPISICEVNFFASTATLCHNFLHFSKQNFSTKSATSQAAALAVKTSKKKRWEFLLWNENDSCNCFSVVRFSHFHRVEFN